MVRTGALSQTHSYSIAVGFIISPIHKPLKYGRKNEVKKDPIAINTITMEVLTRVKIFDIISITSVLNLNYLFLSSFELLIVRLSKSIIPLFSMKKGILP